jgi:nucleotidyltransferase/DNA polymerase involved in DNA repair
MKLAVGHLERAMVKAVRVEASDLYASSTALFAFELRRLAQSLHDIDDLVRGGEITAERARTLVEIQQVTARSVLATIEGLGAAGAEQVMRAAIGAVSETVNTVIGFPLL